MNVGLALPAVSLPSPPHPRPLSREGRGAQPRTLTGPLPLWERVPSASEAGEGWAPCRSTMRLMLVTVLAAALWLAAALPAAAQPARTVESVGMTVSDLDRAVAFYTEVLTFQPVSETEVAGAAFEQLTGVFGARARIARLRLGEEVIELTAYLAPEGRPYPVDSRSNDRWFQHIAIVVRDMDAAYARLRQHHVRHASTGPQTLPDWNPNAGGIRAFYFRDPDGHYLEVLQFPPGRGDARWHRAGDDLFLGIDHTAIVVADTDASLAFYQDQLGLRVAGTSENWGTEQEHLNTVFGARLRITTLRAAHGPGIELLQYLAPGGGRPAPLDTAANDLWHWQVRVAVDDAQAAAAAAREGDGTWISPGAVATEGTVPGAAHAAMVRDPDGHALVLTSD